MLLVVRVIDVTGPSGAGCRRRRVRARSPATHAQVTDRSGTVSLEVADAELAVFATAGELADVVLGPLVPSPILEVCHLFAESWIMDPVCGTFELNYPR